MASGSQAGGSRKRTGGTGAASGGNTMARRLGPDVETEGPAVSTVHLQPAPEATIDGSLLEGGGQILRMGMALAVAAQRRLHIKKVRAKRAKPGLQPQHLAGVELVAATCFGQLEGAQLKSGELWFRPGPPKRGAFWASPGTAGSTTLLVQAVLPCLLLAQGTKALQTKSAPRSSAPSDAVNSTDASIVHLEGGTNNPLAPPVDYFQHVLVPILRRHFHLDISVDLIRRGFYPAGGGEIRLRVGGAPEGPLSTLAPLQGIPERLTAIALDVESMQLLERGHVVYIHCRAFSAGQLPLRVAEVMLEHAQQVLQEYINRRPCSSEQPVRPQIMGESVYEKATAAVGTGAGILLIAHTSTGCLLASSQVLERGARAEDAGSAAALELVDQLETGGCVDQYLQDQLIIFIAFAKGRSQMLLGEPSLHTRTAILLAEQLSAARFRLVPPLEPWQDQQSSLATSGPSQAPQPHVVSGSASHEAKVAARWREEHGAEISQVELAYALAVSGGRERLKGRPWLLECEGAGIGPIALANELRHQ